MTIETKEYTVFESARLDADNGAELHAEMLEGGEEFIVSVYEGSDENWAFDYAACVEAADFFTRLAEELERRRA